MIRPTFINLSLKNRNEERNMNRSLSKPHLLFFRASIPRNLYHFSKRPSLTFPSKPLSIGVSRIEVRFGTRSMSTSSSSQLSSLLSCTNDDHRGVIVEMSTKEPMDAIVFGSLLRASISHWRQEGKKGDWIKMPIELVNLVEPAVKEGFYFHHAKPKYLMLLYWIPKTANTLHANATHRVGIGAYVMNEKKEVLVVQEKSGILRGTGVWKFPTGVVEEGEDICDDAVREVKEETGVNNKIVILVHIDAKFVEILAFSSQYIVSYSMQWVPLKEYTAQRFVQKNEFLKYISDVCLSKR